MLSLMPRDILMNPKIKYLDAGAGMGIFSIALYFVLVEHGHKTTNIIDNMLNLVEINPINVAVIKKLFHKLVPEYAGSFKNIINNDYLSSDLPYEPNTIDIILGNPPYNGKIKVPTNKIEEKKLDGKAIWTRFVYRSYNLLKSGGMLLLIIPSIWCKPDKAKIYELFTERFEIKYLEFYNNTETNKLFNSQAQTPTCIIFAKKSSPINNNEYKCEKTKTIPIYDTINKTIVPFNLKQGKAIPTCGVRI